MSTRTLILVPGRREALKLLVGTGIASWGCGSADRSPRGTPGAGPKHDLERTSPSLACVVRPAQTEGPYFLDERQRLRRADIRVDPTDGFVSEGVPLELEFGVHQIVEESCAPLVGALVDVWQCDAAGIYSGVVDIDARFNTSGRKFLRGNLLTDARGTARFTTIYPGRYPGRTPHIHFKVRTRLETHQVHELTSQLYFDEALTAHVYAQAPYEPRVMGEVSNSSDFVYRRGGHQLLLDVEPHGTGYRAAFSLGLRFT